MGVVLPLYAPEPPPAWCNDYVGLPYVRGARGPVEWDCWGLFLLVQFQRFGRTLPDHAGVLWNDTDRRTRRHADQVFTAERQAHWTALEPGQEVAGDGIVLRMGSLPLHVGVVAAPGWMLHAAEDADSALERYDNLVWRHRIEGFWRFKEDA